MARACLAAGDRVSVCARTASALEPLAADGIFARGVDIRDEGAVAGWLAAACDRHGPIDILLNNAGALGPRCPLDAYPLEALRNVLDVNVVGTFVVSRAALPHLRRPGALLLHVSSYGGRHGLAAYAGYAAAKFGVEGLAQVLAEELREAGVTSCAVDPGMVQTEMLRAALGTDDVAEHTLPEQAAAGFLRMMAAVGIERSGEPLDLAEFMPA